MPWASRRFTEMIAPYNKALNFSSVMEAWNTDSVQGLAGLAKEINQRRR